MISEKELIKKYENDKTAFKYIGHIPKLLKADAIEIIFRYEGKSFKSRISFDKLNELLSGEYNKVKLHKSNGSDYTYIIPTYFKYNSKIYDSINILRKYSYNEDGFNLAEHKDEIEHKFNSHNTPFSEVVKRLREIDDYANFHYDYVIQDLIR